ncbi:MAG: DNA mismatch repair endonuclease MutL [Proteobacteria bacterium]|nr:DNA mismatch repair endonuclease MutL [Pseudomonadota bacterium]
MTVHAPVAAEAPASRQPIAVLDPAVVEQIAAGEVIDRPASVVKELVENAIDAGATRITIELEQGGLRLIRVVDDGCGMTAEQARLSLQRYATSKLCEVADLDRIATLGFRGEGLPSVAAVSRLTLTTRPSRALAGVEIAVEAGRVISQQPAGCAAGTAVAMRELFFNTPARRKFMRSTATETGHVQELIAWLACAFPAVAFALLHEGRRLLELPPVAGRAQRAQGLAAARGQPPLVGRAERGGVVVEALLQPLEAARSTGRALVLLVNQRVVRDRTLLQAALGGCGSALAHGRFPAGVIHLEVDPQRVDVNVHPQKREVRFAEPQAVRAAVVAAVAQAVGGAAARGSVAASEGAAADRAPPAAVRVYGLRATEPLPGDGAACSAAAFGSSRAAEAQRRFWGASEAGAAHEGDYGLGAALARVVPTGPAPMGPALMGPAPAGPAPTACRAIGWTADGLLVAQWDGRLVLVDEQAGWCAVVLSALRQALAAGDLAGAALSPPPVIRLDARGAAALAARRQRLRQLGFELEPLDHSAWLLRTRPAAVALADASWEAILLALAGGWVARPTVQLGSAGADAALVDEVALALAWAVARTRAAPGWRPRLAEALGRAGAESLQWSTAPPWPTARGRAARPMALALELDALRALLSADP